jgi:hypothetical protein
LSSLEQLAMPKTMPTSRVDCLRRPFIAATPEVPPIG